MSQTEPETFKVMLRLNLRSGFLLADADIRDSFRCSAANCPVGSTRAPAPS